uniref:Uncharacterized protein n=1 Tax=Vitis vinifera TaxID=29760 RepID=F6HUK5_VITVI
MVTSGLLWRRGRLALGTPANEARLDISWPQFCHHKFQQWGSDWMPPLPVASVSGVRPCPLVLEKLRNQTEKLRDTARRGEREGAKWRC